MSYRVEGSENFLHLAAALKAADRKLAGRIRKRLRETAKPLGEEAGQALAEAMPHRNGLSAIVARAKAGVSSTTGKTARVEVRLRAPGYDLAAMNAGNLRHPVFGGKAWVGQSVPAEAASRAFEAGMDPMRTALQREVESLLSEINAGRL